MAILFSQLIAADDVLIPHDSKWVPENYRAPDAQFERTDRAQSLFRVDLTQFTIAEGKQLRITFSYNIKVDNPGAEAAYKAAVTGSTTGLLGEAEVTLTAATDAEYRVDIEASMVGVTATENIYVQDKVASPRAAIRRGLMKITYEVVDNPA